MISLSVALALASLSQSPTDIQGLTRDQALALRDALYVEGLEPSDLKAFEPGPTGSAFIDGVHLDPLPKLLKIRKALDEEDSRQLLNRPLTFLRKAFTTLGDPPLARRPTTQIDLPPSVPPSLRSPMIRLVRAVLAAHEEVRASLDKLSPDEKRVLIEGLPRQAVHPSLLQLDFVKRPLSSSSELSALLEKADLPRMHYAAERLYEEVEDVFAELASSTPPSFNSKLKFTVEGITIVLAGLGNDHHEDRVLDD